MSAQLRVWDLPVRLSHWGLALCVTGCFASAYAGWPSMDWHFYCGYGALGCVLFRLLWGLLGGEHARFANFLRGPGAVWAHLRGLLAGPHVPTTGHNPAGGWAVMLLLLLTGVQASLGLFSSDEIQWYGPLSERVDQEWMQWASSWHRTLEFWLLLLIGLHVIAIASYWLLQREALLPAMWHGMKAGGTSSTEPRRAPVWLAWVLVALVAAAIWALLRFWPETAVLDDFGY